MISPSSSAVVYRPTKKSSAASVRRVRVHRGAQAQHGCRLAGGGVVVGQAAADRAAVAHLAVADAAGQVGQRRDRRLHFVRGRHRRVRGAGADGDRARRRRGCPCSSAMPPRSISTAGAARPSFIDCSRLWPPASSLLSSCAAAAAAAAAAWSGFGTRMPACRDAPEWVRGTPELPSSAAAAVRVEVEIAHECPARLGVDTFETIAHGEAGHAASRRCGVAAAPPTPAAACPRRSAPRPAPARASASAWPRTAPGRVRCQSASV